MAKIRKLKKEDIIRDLPEFVNYLNTHGFSKNLKFRLNLFLNEDKTFDTCKVNLEGGSYVDKKTHKNIVIDVGPVKGLSVGRALLTMMGKGYHEVGHINFTNQDAWEQFVTDFGEYFELNHGIKKAISSYFGNYIMNCIEDGREECMMASEYPATQTALMTMRGFWWTDLVKVSGENELSDNLICFASLSSIGRMPFNFGKYYPDEYKMWQNLKPFINKFSLQKTLDNGIPILWDIIHIIEEWLADLMSKQPDPDELKKTLDEISKSMPGGGLPSSAPGSSSSKTGSSTSSSGKSSSDKSTGDTGDEGEDESKDEDEENPSNPMHDSFNDENNDGSADDIGRIDNEDNGVLIDEEESMKRTVENQMKQAENDFEEMDFKNIVQDSFEDKKNPTTETVDGDLNDNEVNEILNKYNSMSSRKRDGEWAIPLKFHHYQDPIVVAPEKIRISAKPLRNQLKKLFENQNSEVIFDRKKGTLNSNQLYKLVKNDVNVFTRKTIPHATDFAVYLLIDGSGSMGTNKFLEAYKAASLLEEALKGMVPLKIAQFDCDSEVHHRIVKDFKDENRKGNFAWTYSNHHGSQSCNMDGYSIRVAEMELLKRPERNKILIILSDGQPSGYYSYSGTVAETDVKQAVREGRKSGLKIFNIMFGTTSDRASMKQSFKYMYEKGIVSTSPENIGKELIRMIKGEIF